MTRTKTLLSPLLCDLVATDRAGWEAPIFIPLHEEPPVVLPRQNRALARASAALGNVTSADPDAATTRADLRTAICIARGRDVEDICPSMGYDLSAAGFRTARDSWREHLAAHRPNEWTWAEHDRARAFWAKARPDLIGDWPEVQR